MAYVLVYGVSGVGAAKGLPEPPSTLSRDHRDDRDHRA